MVACLIMLGQDIVVAGVYGRIELFTLYSMKK